MRHALEQSPRTSPENSQTALELFFALGEEWSLTADQQIRLLGTPARSTFFKWKKEGGIISRDTIERISHLLSIYKALHILFPDPDRADAWLRRPNKYFEEHSALDVMLDGTLSDIYRVRAYVDAQRGG
jgi:uncharacterized protein (DUF2384 family)